MVFVLDCFGELFGPVGLLATLWASGGALGVPRGALRLPGAPPGVVLGGSGNDSGSILGSFFQSVGGHFELAEMFGRKVGPNPMIVTSPLLLG